MGIVIPCYKVGNSIIKVISCIESDVDMIAVIDDYCPEKSGKIVELESKDPRVKVIYNRSNLGVGGSVLVGYEQCFENGMDIVVKIDGDGQMDTSELKNLIRPILENRADYTKGNRFHYFKSVAQMPKMRIIGNLILSFFSKLSTGYWNIFDPTNGYTAISKDAYKYLEVSNISKRYFFESDMLHHLYMQNAQVIDIPMEANYGNEKSNLKIWKIIPEFLFKHSRNTLRRIIYSYYVRDFTLASIQLPLGLGLLFYGIVRAFQSYIHNQAINQATPTGTLILLAMTILTGLQFTLAFFAYDIQATQFNSVRKK